MKLKHALYTTEEARELLGLSSTAIVRSYLADRYLEGVKLPSGQWLVTRSSLQEKLDRQAKIDENTERVKAGKEAVMVG